MYIRTYVQLYTLTLPTRIYVLLNPLVYISNTDDDSFNDLSANTFPPTYIYTVQMITTPNTQWPPGATLTSVSGNPNSSCNCDCAPEPLPGGRTGTLKGTIRTMALSTI